MGLSDTRQTWEDLGRSDPLWAILTIPAMKGNRWERDAFFETGEVQIGELFQRLEQLGLSVERGRCLDFGCGVGRVTQALANRFDRCDGVDIADTMIERAVSWNRKGDRCQFHLNVTSDLSLFEDNTFDFVYTVAVLQHMEPTYAEGYVREFLRVLKPGGLAVFDIPGRADRVEPLPEGAHRASISVDGMPKKLRSGQEITLRVRVTNRGDSVWPLIGLHPITLGNHWQSPAGDIERWDDGRAGMTTSIEPGQSGVFSLEITTPQRVGTYRLVLDMVEESVVWFAERGSTPFVQELEITPPPIASRAWRRLKSHLASAKTGVSGPSPLPRMEMFVIPKERVLEAIGSAGGKVCHIDEYEAHGSGFHTYHYFVTKPLKAADG